ncbi:transmembrane protein 223-domain-containing protein [Absidia repens]|uniref:Transmembrane protein 223-domain-containing protein n=1 Tax=Absidia repens TaxID=90262 RepID=A0A1X2IGW7_9FUNG|nr:transmembrane protein 223-domain-containing protein [Absidia repens]
MNALLRFRSITLPRNVGSVLTFRYASTTPMEKRSVQAGAKQLLKTLQGRDVVFYQAPPNVGRTFFFMYLSAGVQLLFWGNLASLAYVTYSQPESAEEDAPMVLAPQGQRVAVAGGLVMVGLGVAAAMCTYPWRYIDKLVLLKGGERVQLITHAKWIKSHQVKTYPIERLYCKQKVATGVGSSGTEPLGTTTSSHIFLRAKGEKMGYMLDRKGKFTDSKIFDGLWYNLSSK